MLSRQLSTIGALLNDIGPKSEKYEKGRLYVEGGPMIWANGKPQQRVWGPFKNEDEAHNFVAIKIERHKLSNASYHGTDGRPPESDNHYYGHPMFQYRIMDGREYFARYLLQIQNLAAQGVAWLLSDDEPDIIWPNQDFDPESGGLEDGDEYIEEDQEAS